MKILTLPADTGLILETMTVDKKDIITIPKWLVIWVAPMLVSAIVAFGTISAWKGKYETKAARNEQEIQRLDERKVDRKEMDLLLNTLNRIENKLDSHVSQRQ
ncbi:MAG: hypothetical protein JZU47_10810 [Prolixibacteraceae bacterium]|nr:hypothetical protein [Prolixibacteraceae bacterium]